MAESRAKFNLTISPGLFGVATAAYGTIPQTWKEVYTVKGSKKAYERATYVSGYSYMVHKPEGTPYAYDERIQGPEITTTHRTFGLAARITEELIEDELYGVMKRIMADLGISAAATKALLRNRLFMLGDQVTTDPELQAGDLKPIFAPDHDRLGGGTWSNIHPVAADPTEATVSASIFNYENMPDERGKMAVRTVKGIMCGPLLEMQMAKILESAQEAETANNAINALKTRRNIRLVVNPGITDSRWFVFGEKDPLVGFIAFDRVPATTARHGDYETGDAIYQIRMRLSQRAGRPAHVYMVPGI